MIKKIAPLLLLVSMPAWPMAPENPCLEEKIGQMIVMATMANPQKNPLFYTHSPYNLDPNYARDMIKKHHIGGIIFLGTHDPKTQLSVTNALQIASKQPLLVFQDAEWGLSMRMPHSNHVTVFPKAMTLGALSPENDYLIEQLGQEIAQQLRSIGVHSPLAPVCDVNNNPHNPIINTRSFGQNPGNVARKAALFAKGLQKGGALSYAKHFPGHGDTDTDSHQQLSVIPHNRKRLDAVELMPFKEAIKHNVDAIMTAHLDVPALTQEPGVPATLSKKVMTDLLRNELGFDGLIVTDGLGMKGITDNHSHAEIAVNAIHAGCDILLCPVDVVAAIDGIKQAVNNGIISEKEIDEHVARINAARDKLALATDKITFDPNKLKSNHTTELKKKLYRSAVTLARTTQHIPLDSNSGITPVITIGSSEPTPFTVELKKYTRISEYFLDANTSKQELIALNQQLAYEPHVITALHLPSRSGMIEMHSQRSDREPSYINFINRLASRATLVLFGNPYNLAKIPKSGATIVAYENEPEAQRAAAEVLAGLHDPTGQLPVSANDDYPEGCSLRFE